MRINTLLDFVWRPYCVFCFIFAVLMFGLPAFSTNVYVVPPDTPGASPDGIYTSWPTAATNIQEAIDAINTNNGNIVYISNGVYMLTNEIVVNKGVVLCSWSNGVTARESTILDGNNYAGKPVTNRVLWLTNSAAILDGLTIQNGVVTNAHGGGIVIFKSLLITNCIIQNNASVPNLYAGGGIYISDPWLGKITHCLINSNYASRGAGMYVARGTTGIVEYCTIISNYASHGDVPHGGGGLCLYGNSVDPYPGSAVTARWCTIANNTAYSCGGGVDICFNGGTVENCLITSNYQIRTTSGTRQGSGVYVYLGSAKVRNSLIVANSNGGNFAAVCLCRGGCLENCTVVNNRNGGVIGLNPSVIGAGTGVVVNSIVYSNRVYDAIYTNQLEFTNCCVSAVVPGANNITNYPKFIDPAGDYHLPSDSPCVNAGLNLSWMFNPDALDLDGQRRVGVLHRRVDMGCYEYLFRGAMFGIR